MRNIVLIGFMGTGKSAVGRKLARALGFSFFDTDRFIEDKTGKTVAQIFHEDGEERFRALEVEAVQAAVGEDRRVIATGGGTIVNPLNWERLNHYGTVVWLRSCPEVILQRVQKKSVKRPLLNVNDPREAIRRLLEEREPYYERASFSVDTSRVGIDELGDVVSEIKRKVYGIEANAYPG